ncbi:unnamed protein product [marine sediment metagenome]|uniref:Uncharacterized protein n=1 Tax=marine sediment metagenome TaxID=412755 RepID=X1PUZ6_9ZZZZ
MSPVADVIGAITILLGYEDIDYWHQETDPNWWAIRLWISRN